MQEWCLQHPWMTFFLSFFCIETVSVVLQKAVDSRKRPAKTAVFHGRLVGITKPSGLTKEVVTSRDDLN